MTQTDGPPGGSDDEAPRIPLFRADGRRCVELRRLFELNQRDFGMLLGLSPSLVAKWETGGEVNRAHRRLLDVLWLGPASRREHIWWREILRTDEVAAASACFLYLAGQLDIQELRRWR